jgi:hypothetical protein
VARDWRRLQNEELYNLYASPNIIRVNRSTKMRWAMHVARMGEMRNRFKILAGRPEGKRPRGRPRRRWEGYIRTDLTDNGVRGLDRIHMAKDRDQWRALLNAVMNIRI